MNKEKQIQIPESTFAALCSFFILGNKTAEIENLIKPVLEEKIEAKLKRDIYSKSKIAPTEKEREQARQQYLDLIGMNKNFRW